jgi:hypothetical protein
MADNEVPIKITGDATEVKDAADAAKEHLDRVSKSVEMLGDLIGLKVPDGISKMLAASELIGPVLDAAFAPLAVITLGIAIFDLTEKLKKEREELEKTKAETLNESLAVNQYATALQTNNLKLQDQLAILQKRPPTNGVKIAMEEGRKATADLVDEFTKAIDKLDELLQKQKQGFWDRLMNGNNGSNEVIDKAHEFKTAIDDLSQQMNTAAALGHQKEAADYKTSLDKKQAEFRRYIADQQKALADKKAAGIDTLTKRDESVASGPNGETQVREALSLADATKQVNEQYRDEQRLLNDLTIYSESYGAASAQVAKNNALSRQIAVAEAQKSSAAFKKEQSDKVSTVDASTRAIIAIDESASKQTMAADFAAIKAENDAVIKAANEQFQTWDEGYKGQIEVAKIAGEVKIQLITQDFEKGKITQQQEIALIAKAKQDELQLEIFYQQKRQALWDKDPKKVQEIQNQINKIKAQGEVVGAKAVTDGLKAQEQQYRQAFSQIGNAFKTEILGMIQGTETVAQGFAKMFNSLIGSFADYVAQKAEKKAEEWLIDKLFTQKKITSATAASSGIAALAGFASAMQALPFPINVSMAPAVAAAAGATASGMGAIAMGAASLAIGTDFVPMDGLAYLHKGEKVIPASMQGPGYSGGGGITIVVNHSVSAVDAASFQGHIRRHSNMIANEVTRALKRKGAR